MIGTWYILIDLRWLALFGSRPLQHFPELGFFPFWSPLGWWHWLSWHHGWILRATLLPSNLSMSLWWAPTPILYSNCAKSAVFPSFLPLLLSGDAPYHPHSPSILFSSPSMMLEEAPFILIKVNCIYVHYFILSFVHLFTHFSNMYLLLLYARLWEYNGE